MAIFHLKCVMCGHKWTDDAENCRGEDNPDCPKCSIGIGILEKVSDK